MKTNPSSPFLLFFERYDTPHLLWVRLFSDPRESAKVLEAPPAPESSVQVLHVSSLMEGGCRCFEKPGTLLLMKNPKEKLLRYQAKPSLQASALISQEVQHMEVIPRTAAGWDYQEYGHDGQITLTRLNVVIAVSEMYRRLSIPLEKRLSLPLEMIEIDDQHEES